MKLASAIEELRQLEASCGRAGATQTSIVQQLANLVIPEYGHAQESGSYNHIRGLDRGLQTESLCCGAETFWSRHACRRSGRSHGVRALRWSPSAADSIATFGAAARLALRQHR